MFNFWYFVLVDLTWLIDIEVLHGDFLNLNPMDPSYSKVKFRGLWIVQGSHIAVICNGGLSPVLHVLSQTIFCVCSLFIIK